MLKACLATRLQLQAARVCLPYIWRSYALFTLHVILVCHAQFISKWREANRALNRDARSKWIVYTRCAGKQYQVKTSIHDTELLHSDVSLAAFYGIQAVYSFTACESKGKQESVTFAMQLSVWIRCVYAVWEVLLLFRFFEDVLERRNVFSLYVVTVEFWLMIWGY